MLASTRCDAHWLDQLVDGPADPAAVAGYWSGQPVSGQAPVWEYLLDGQIAIVDREDRERLDALKWRHAPLPNYPPSS